MEENMQSVYYRASLQKIVQKYITEKQYGVFKPILEEIFYRRAYEFEFSDKQIKNELENFRKKVRKIKIINKTNDYRRLATYSYKKRRISIYYENFLLEKQKVEKEIENIKNKKDRKSLIYKLLEDNKQSLVKERLGKILYQVISHEVYHAISDDGNYIGLMNKKDNKGLFLNEVFTEAASNRTNNVEYLKKGDYRRNTRGYTEITFISSMLAASLGIYEKEILREGIQNKNKLLQKVISRFPSSMKNATINLYKQLEDNVDNLGNVLYKNKVCSANMYIQYLSDLYNNLYEIAYEQIANDNIELSQKNITNLIYRFRKMENMLKSSINFLDMYYLSKYSISSVDFINGIISDKNKRAIYRNILNSRKRLCNKIVELYKVQNKISGDISLNNIPIDKEYYRDLFKKDIGVIKDEDKSVYIRIYNILDNYKDRFNISKVITRKKVKKTIDDEQKISYFKNAHECFKRLYRVNTRHNSSYKKAIYSMEKDKGR